MWIFLGAKGARSVLSIAAGFALATMNSQNELRRKKKWFATCIYFLFSSLVYKKLSLWGNRMMLEGVCLQEDLVIIFIQELAPFSLQDSFSAFGFLLSCFHKSYQSIATSASSVGENLLFFSSPFSTLPLTAYQGCKFCSRVLVLVVRRSSRALSQTSTYSFAGRAVFGQ